jgi:hypothetical protein
MKGFRSSACTSSTTVRPERAGSTAQSSGASPFGTTHAATKVQRISIVGNGGSGKSWLAASLHDLSGLPVLPTDDAYLRPDWTKRPASERASIESAWWARDGWIIEGLGLDSLRERAQHCDLVVLLDVPALVCLTRVLRRRLRLGAGRNIPARDRLRGRFLLHVALFRFRAMPRVRRALADAPCHVVIVRWPGDAESELRKLYVW